MEHTEILAAGFYLWWLGINGCLYFAEFSFIQNFTGIRIKRYLAPYLLLSSLLTFLTMYCQSSGIFRLILHTGIIICFSIGLLGMKWIHTIAPAVIILTLFTFMEGFQTILMRWLSGQEMAFRTAIVMQMLVSVLLVLLFVMTLHYISNTYSYTGQQRISSCLYSLFLPCAFIVWVIRSGLGLDMWMNTNVAGVIPVGRDSNHSNLWALIWILGACAIFFIILKLIAKIIQLSVQETEQKGFEAQIRKQSVYLEEAKKRNETYRRFQHDIDNHFLVLSGLLHEKKYQEAERYFDHLHSVSDELLIGVETGNPIADIILNEKISYAKSNSIKVKHDIRISSDCPVADMDLCIILANAMDNAIQACIKQRAEHPQIWVMLCKRHQFLIFEITNTVAAAFQTVEYGTGLKNIRHTVEKYEGTMEIEEDKHCFKLTILLCLKPLTNGEAPFTETIL
ncbi:MAG: GHKL domain-containing protein [Lachnospiraceae bacterium]|nr:GHKL domain-containing protein [Lachnospiraceae bacterium]